MQELVDILKDFLHSGILPALLMLIRAVVPVMALYVVWRSYTSFRKGQRRRDPVIMLADHESKIKFPVLYWETSIGRSKSCDIVLPDESVSRDHAVLMRREEGWIICDTGSKTGVKVNGSKISDNKVVNLGDEITIGSTNLMLMNADETVAKKRKAFRGFSAEAASPFKLMFVTMLVHLLMALQLCVANTEWTYRPLLLFAGISVLGWGLYIYTFAIKRRISFELETVAFLLSGIGILLISAHNEAGARTQVIAMAIGMVIFSFMIWFMGDLKRVEKAHLFVGGGALLLFVINMVFGTSIYGAKNWIIIGGLSIQPSELIKIAFIFFGASTLDKLQTKKNITEFLIFAVICMAFLFLMRDLGTAVIFFACFLIIAFMRSGSVRTIALSLTAAVLGVVLIMTFMPHAISRFSNWGHIWEDVGGGGYQQTHMLTYLASGGFFGVGLGKGYLNEIFASDSDIVFGLLCEEQGLLLGLVVVAAVAMFTLYARSDVVKSRSTFYSITACATAGMLLFQLCLNLFGSTDIIPFTGVTLPFISAGGTSMMSVWGLLAFMKASDERTYAVKRITRREAREEEKENSLREEQEIREQIRRNNENSSAKREGVPTHGRVRRQSQGAVSQKPVSGKTRDINSVNAPAPNSRQAGPRLQGSKRPNPVPPSSSPSNSNPSDTNRRYRPERAGETQQWDNISSKGRFEMDEDYNKKFKNNKNRRYK